MTPAQQKCLKFISDYIAANGFSPSYDEIGAHMDLVSKSGVFRMVQCLERAGKVQRLPHVARSLEVVHDHRPTAERIADRLNERGYLCHMPEVSWPEILDTIEAALA